MSKRTAKKKNHKVIHGWGGHFVFANGEMIAGLSNKEHRELRGVEDAGDKYNLLFQKSEGRPKHDVDLDAVKKLRRKGLSFREIGERLGISKDTAQRRYQDSINPLSYENSLWADEN